MCSARVEVGAFLDEKANALDVALFYGGIEAHPQRESRKLSPRTRFARLKRTHRVDDFQKNFETEVLDDMVLIGSA